MLSKEEHKRYARQMILPEVGLDGQQKLQQAKVLVVGAGGLGCPVLQYLTAAGVGTIGIVDDDVVDISNLHRQILYHLQDIGNNKALVAKEKLQMLNPHVKFAAYTERLTRQNAHDIIRHYDLVIDGSDNFPTRYLVNDICVDFNRPLIFGSIFKFEGQISVINYQNGPNYRDLFPEPPAAGEVPNCSEIGVIGVLPGVIGTLMANEAIKVICSIGDVLSGKLMMLDALISSASTFSFAGQSPALPLTAINIEVHGDNVAEIAVIHEIEQELLKAGLQTAPMPIMLVDVREPYEFAEFNIGGINIPLDELSERIAEIKPAAKVVFCCKSGVRSRQAAELFAGITKQDCYHLKDGILNF